jgi:hypothetical protein
MSILTKSNIEKGTVATFSINKSQLLIHPIIANDEYFSDSLNWNRINLVYKSSEGSQYEVVEFNATQESPTGTFLVSENARNDFHIQKIQIIDFDGGFLEIPRSEVQASEFDISFV